MGWSLVSTGCHGYMYFYYYRTYDKAVTRSGGGKVVTGCHGLPRVFGLWMCAGCHGLSRSRLCAGSEGPPLITPVMICDDVLVVVNFSCCVKRKCSGLTGHISEAGNTVITPLFFHHPWSGVGNIDKIYRLVPNTQFGDFPSSTNSKKIPIKLIQLNPCIEVLSSVLKEGMM